MRAKDGAGLTLAALASLLLGCGKEGTEPEKPSQETVVEVKKPIPFEPKPLPKVEHFKAKYRKLYEYTPPNYDPTQQEPEIFSVSK